MRLVRHPVLCNYYLTYRCNARCSFCDIWERPSPYVQREAVFKNLKDARRLGVEIIDFTGGEPLLHRELPVFLEYAQKLGFITTVTTNALLYPKYAEALRGKIDMLHFSLDGADADTHNAIRGVHCFDHVMRSIEIALELGERPDILFTATNHNIQHIQSIWEKICLPHRLVLIINPVFHYNDVGEALSKESLMLLRKWAKKPWVYLNEAFLKLREQGGNDPQRPVCKAGSSTLVISPDNELIVPCYHLSAARFPIRNNLFDLYNSPEVQKWVALEGRLNACKGCAINCYMQPSFAVEMNAYWWLALRSTLKYNYLKGTWRRYLVQKIKARKL
ncbi:MoaA/NifB/PqqE/SkfB family radical SAM enzyme [Thermonema lapsum]|uniref:MoaA/NifB/PqqE/SkfB family radical SAM enzyme n=1 Tax=Thermonema lapsum TaxID=28195 RepID=A0A846MTT9_9BACT|nr:radical SAM protein [Thermonema lapsum]NIK74869.1 MoaA/NifB/PqqE/SkfB family radical SAM enzyme [Thermonema lapsum]